MDQFNLRIIALVFKTSSHAIWFGVWILNAISTIFLFHLGKQFCRVSEQNLDLIPSPLVGITIFYLVGILVWFRFSLYYIEGWVVYNCDPERLIILAYFLGCQLRHLFGFFITLGRSIKRFTSIYTERYNRKINFILFEREF